MMIRAQNLTKNFGALAAVNDISFEIQRGEIVAFLGSKRCRQDDHHQNAHHLVEAHQRPHRVGRAGPGQPAQ